jgi:pimeloyl-ACP methyl ester carboxylesterase
MPDPLVLLPGTLCDRRVWEPMLARLGRSDAIVPDVTTHHTARALAAAVLANAPPRFALAGFSLGGFVALEMINLAPDRVAALALISTTARPLSDAEIVARRTRWAVTRDEPVAMVVARDLWPIYVATSRRHDDDLRDLILRMADDVGRSAWVRQFDVALSRKDMRPILGSIRAPTLVITGEEDKLCPPDHAAEMGKGIPGATLEILPETGHFLPLETPNRLAQAMSRIIG